VLAIRRQLEIFEIGSVVYKGTLIGNQMLDALWWNRCALWNSTYYYSILRTQSRWYVVCVLLSWLDLETNNM